MFTVNVQIKKGKYLHGQTSHISRPVKITTHNEHSVTQVGFKSSF